MDSLRNDQRRPPAIDRRRALLAGLALLPTLARAADARACDGAAASDAPLLRLATAWRGAGRDGTVADRVGVVEIDWAASRVRMHSEQFVSTRAHGLLALRDGGFLAVANRPGRWLLRFDAEGRAVERLDADAERPKRTLNGHVESSTDARWLYTTETDPVGGQAWISVRDARTLAREAQFATGGVDAHQLLRAPDDTLVIGNGGIVRDTQGRKIEPDRMAPSLVRIDPGRGELLGVWRLADPRLSLRHLAWAEDPGGAGDALPLLGIALQAEHDRPEDRLEAPALAVWDGCDLTIPCADASASGYVGDIAAGPGGGFVLSAQKVGRGLWWRPDAPQQLTLVAELTEPCALQTWGAGEAVLISSVRGIARWHARLAPRMLPWPVPLAPDNHWVMLAPV